MVAGYLERLGMPRPSRSDAGALAALHRAHLDRVPFENLSIHLGEPLSLDSADLIDKIVTRQRGGFCYELNGAFAMLLAALGFRVGRLAARVASPAGLGPPLDHLVLLVHPDDGSGPWLADVGFGDHAALPIRFDLRTDQPDPAGTFRLADAPPDDIDVLRDSTVRYRVERRERELSEFAAMCWYQEHSPQSHFTRNLVCSRLADGERVSISGRTLIRTRNGVRSEQPLPADHDLLQAFQDHFDIRLARVPEIVAADQPAGT